MEGIPGGVGIEEGRAAVVAARDFLLGLGERAAFVQEGDLGELMAQLAGLGRAVGAATVAVAVEADQRGLPRQSGPFGSLGGDLKAWVAERSPGLPVAEVARVVRVVRGGRAVVHAPVLAAVTSGRVDVRAADVCLTEIEKVRHFFSAEHLGAVWEGYLLAAESGDARVIRAERDDVIATLGREGEFQDLADVAARHVSLSSPRPVDGPAGIGSLWAYRLVTDEAGKSITEAAIGPLSKPVPGPDGEPDTRLSERRRAEALVGMLQRGTAAGDRVPSVVKTQLLVTIKASDLVDRTGAAEVLGTIDPGLLAPETTRRLACDSAVTPVVVDDAGNLLNLGRTRRLFSSGQLKALWLRDRGCTYPGCDAPAHWCDGHHLVHWADGGCTDLTNAALLCGHHHTVVHQRRLTATVGPDGRVEWDLVPGSYDRTAARSGGRRTAPGSRGDPPESRGDPPEPEARVG